MKKIISVLLVLCLAFSCITAMAESKWTKASDWAIPELEKALEAGVYPTALENKDLTGNITRAEQAALTVKIYEAVTGTEAPSGDNPFTDTNDAEIVKAFKLGITSGTTATTFSPDENLTREQAAAMLARVYKKIKGTEELKFDMPQQFADHSSISDYAIESVYFMNAQGYIKGTEAGFEPKGLCTREQALAIAQRMAINLKAEAPAEPEKQPEAEKEDFVIAFIGGSLTQGGTVWQGMIKKYVQEKMPDKNVKIINSGIGGTTSEYGAKRFAKDVLSFNPDMVFIEFAVNDRSFGTKNAARHQIYMESMVYQCLNAEKVPAVTFFYANHAYEDTDLEKVEFSRKAKEELAKFYGIPSIDAHEYGLNLYDNDKEKTSTSYRSWLIDEKKYYPEDNVHPYSTGYGLFGEAILAAFEKDGLEKYLVPLKEKNGLFCIADSTKVMSRYNYLYVTDPKIDYAGEWYLCNKETPRNELAIAIPTSFYKHPYYPQGGMYTCVADSTMTFKTSAPEIFISYISATTANDIIVLIDGKEVKTISTTSPYHNMNYVAGVTGTDGKTVTLKAKNNTPLRIMAIIERFDK